MIVYQFLCVSFFPFGFEGGMWDLIVLIPDHCISIYFQQIYKYVSSIVHVISDLSIHKFYIYYDHSISGILQSAIWARLFKALLA